MTDRRKIQLLSVALAGMIAFGVYKIGSALITGMVETRLVSASWTDNPAVFVMLLALLVVGTVAFSPWLFVIVHDGHSGRQHTTRQPPTFERPEYRSSVPDETLSDKHP
jgi:hypothetical protein